MVSNFIHSRRLIEQDREPTYRSNSQIFDVASRHSAQTVMSSQSNGHLNLASVQELHRNVNQLTPQIFCQVLA